MKSNKLSKLMGHAGVLALLIGCGQPGTSDVTDAREQQLASLRETNQELQRLLDENQDLPRLRRENEELKRLRAQTEALPRLLEENQRLRSEIEALQPRGRPPTQR
jgi:predicted nuclease with TOPRIM domain